MQDTKLVLNSKFIIKCYKFLINKKTYINTIYLIIVNNNILILKNLIK